MTGEAYVQVHSRDLPPATVTAAGLALSWAVVDLGLAVRPSLSWFTAPDTIPPGVVPLASITDLRALAPEIARGGFTQYAGPGGRIYLRHHPGVPLARVVGFALHEARHAAAYQRRGCTPAPTRQVRRAEEREARAYEEQAIYPALNADARLRELVLRDPGTVLV